SEYPSPTSPEVRREIGGEGRGKGRGCEALRARSRRLRPPVAHCRPRRARPRCAFPSPCPLRREARARPPPAADRVVSSARRASPPSVHIAAAPEPGSPGRPGGGGEGGTGREACQARGGDALRGTGGGGRAPRRPGPHSGGPSSPPPPGQRALDLRRLHPTRRGAAPSVNPDPLSAGTGAQRPPEEGVAGARRAKFEAGEAASGAPGFSGGAGAQMATQVEPLLPGGAPLLQAEEHGGLVRKKPPPSSEGKGEPGANDVGGGEPDGGARRPRPPCAKPHKEGTGQLERESPRPPQPPGAEGPAVSDGEEGGGGGEPAAGGGAAGAAGAGRRDFVEAPPPKVNPWTKNALPPVLATVNGQSPPG
ncbi:collagen alpha-1(III) chain-like, partial [Physeter macrocephalus]|uniref:Collagen alpha-1(III) chain-like n=1 Tax=Physeter macrocephalus TaxID=9755 RepID=A0A455BFW7_PHYMC